VLEGGSGQDTSRSVTLAKRIGAIYCIVTLDELFGGTGRREMSEIDLKREEKEKMVDFYK
jgi:hypothetical protein